MKTPMNEFVLYVTLVGIIISAIVVILSRNAIHSLLSLVTGFILSAVVLFLLECELLAVLFIIIYVGAIAVLFLFAIMMLESKSKDLSKKHASYIPIGVFFGGIFLAPLVYKIHQTFGLNEYSIFLNTYPNWFDLVDAIPDVKVYGQVLYTYFVLQFLVTGLILLLALVGVIHLTNNTNKKQKMSQSVFKQIAREATSSSTKYTK
jgi:NADH-quinone oxidoreductase subunit J